MLLKFSCKNFRSIRETQELSLVATKTRTDEKSEVLISTPIEGLKLLRCAVIYGPNASGKSNVLDALQAFSGIVSASWRNWKANGPIPEFDPFLLSESTPNELTEFEISFLYESAVYRYGFSFDKNSFSEEHLVDATKSREKVLFRRTASEGKVVVSFPSRNLGVNIEVRQQLDRISYDTRPNSLFLSAAAQFNSPLLSKIYDYLTVNFKPVHWKNLSGREQYTAELCSNLELRDRFVAMVKFADIGIDDFAVTQTEMPDEEWKRIQKMLSVIREDSLEKSANTDIDMPERPSTKEIRMAHIGEGGKKYYLDKPKESDGTLAYFSILGPLLDCIQDGEVLLIDELETSLHPELAREIIRMINSPDFNRAGGQVIFTTHNTNLLDLDLLRRDQIWMTEKNQEGATTLRPLTDYKPRAGQNIEAAYLSGRFGAVPFLDRGLLRESLEAITKPSEVSQAILGEPSNGQE